MELVKLTFSSHKTVDCSDDPIATIKAFINPEAYTRAIAINYDEPDVAGTSDQWKVFKGMGSTSLTLNKIVVDGTGVVPQDNFEDMPEYKNVDAYIKAFRNIVCKYNGDTHQPDFVKIIWSSLHFTGVCTSFTVNYTMFKPDGSPLRASIDLVLQSSMSPKTESQNSQRKSPDLTHVRTVKAGDTLPLMTFRIYGDPTYYPEVARVNGLKNMYALKPGDQIQFPPLKK